MHRASGAGGCGGARSPPPSHGALSTPALIPARLLAASQASGVAVNPVLPWHPAAVDGAATCAPWPAGLAKASAAARDAALAIADALAADDDADQAAADADDAARAPMRKLHITSDSVRRRHLAFPSPRLAAPLLTSPLPFASHLASHPLHRPPSAVQGDESEEGEEEEGERYDPEAAEEALARMADAGYVAWRRKAEAIGTAELVAFMTKGTAAEEAAAEEAAAEEAAEEAAAVDGMDGLEEVEEAYPYEFDDGGRTAFFRAQMATLPAALAEAVRTSTPVAELEWQSVPLRRAAAPPAAAQCAEVPAKETSGTAPTNRFAVLGVEGEDFDEDAVRPAPPSPSLL
jgi:hypothetical protein